MAFRQTLLVDPRPISMPAGLTAVQVSKAVNGALVGRTWVVTAEHADGIDAALNGNDYQAKSHVAFDTHQVKISYVDSTNLKYKVKKDGTRLIHTGYMNWMRQWRHRPGSAVDFRRRRIDADGFAGRLISWPSAMTTALRGAIIVSARRHVASTAALALLSSPHRTDDARR
ncbi:MULTISPECIES: hypothetical protein [Rhodanobacter]|uniref:hypothetical protein n=1 Tax=Rhodanobacter TaxID=75309 RepID=UPI0003F4E7D6|nr:MULTISPECIES: hypothetical protein [Rhodanobacter]UJJ55254.1 hypothetical protein LRK53_02280 [Rhodanobacter thiooxydans]